MFRYFDAHSHPNDAAFDDDRDAVLARMEELSVATVVVGTDRVMSEKAIALATRVPSLWAAIGQHPVDHQGEVFDRAWYEAAADTPRVVAIGECGLDYYWPSREGWKSGEEVEKKRQEELFRAQIRLAREKKLPLMLHIRTAPKTLDAYDDALRILKEEHAEGDRVGDVHFFAGDERVAHAFLDRGFTVSFPGTVTFTHEYDDIVRAIPLDRLLAETDAPYVAPAPYRGKRNEPSYVAEIVRTLAEIRHEDPETLRVATVANACRLYGIEG